MTGEVKQGETYAFEVVRTGRKGDGMAYVNGFVVFVKGAQAGERCMARVVMVKDTFAIAEKI